MNAARLREEKTRLKDVESEIARNISDIHGISMVSASAIVSEIGDVGQFDSAEKLQSYGGKVPDISGSGGKTYSKGSTKIRNPHLSNTVHECAIS